MTKTVSLISLCMCCTVVQSGSKAASNAQSGVSPSTTAPLAQGETHMYSTLLMAIGVWSQNIELYSVHRITLCFVCMYKSLHCIKRMLFNHLLFVPFFFSFM